MATSTEALATLTDALDELGLTSDGGAQDARLERYIDSVTELIQVFCGRTFKRAAIIDEEVAGFISNVNLILARPPINDTSLSTIIIKHAGDVISTDVGVDIHDAKAGLITNTRGWTQNSSWRGSIASEPVPGTERKRYAVTYNGGWIVPGQTAAGSGDTYEGAAVTLPAYVTDACLDEVVQRWRTRGKRRDVRSERIGSAAESYATSPTSGSGLLASTMAKLAPVNLNFGD